MVVISNGFQKFHLSVAAAEASKRDSLSAFLTGAYPTPAIRKMLALPFLRTNRKAARLSARLDEIPDSQVHTFFWPELLNILGNSRYRDKLLVKSFISYGRAARNPVKLAAVDGARIYHYRAGSGGESVQVAKDLGMITLCDHSIAHPRVLEALIENGGRFPKRPEQLQLNSFHQYLLEDINRADAVLVNSDFVKDTFDYVGHKGSPVYTIYLGVDEFFFRQIPKREASLKQPIMLTIGLQKRKGGEVLLAALQHLRNHPWNLQMFGTVEPAMVDSCSGFLADPRVRGLGHLTRPEVGAVMSRADIFVFPSLAEGSARAIFEALACGCYIITTPNSGSIVEDGVHGRLVPPGDSEALASAIDEAYSDPARVAEIGARNAELVRTTYRQKHYGDKLATLYSELLTRGILDD